MVIRLAKHDGIRTLNIVRRPDVKAELAALGADLVIAASDGPIEDQVRTAIGNDTIRHALDPVGGAIGTSVFRALGPDGRLVVYGSLSGEPLQIESRPLISENKTIQGFWLGHWMRSRSVPQALLLFREIGRLTRAGVLSTQPGPHFGLDDIKAAVAASEAAARQGKALLTLKWTPYTGPLGMLN